MPFSHFHRAHLCRFNAVLAVSSLALLTMEGQSRADQFFWEGGASLVAPSDPNVVNDDAYTVNQTGSYGDAQAWTGDGPYAPGAGLYTSRAPNSTDSVTIEGYPTNAIPLQTGFIVGGEFVGFTGSGYNISGGGSANYVGFFGPGTASVSITATSGAEITAVGAYPLQDAQGGFAGYAPVAVNFAGGSITSPYLSIWAGTDLQTNSTTSAVPGATDGTLNLNGTSFNTQITEVIADEAGTPGGFFVNPTDHFAAGTPTLNGAALNATTELALEGADPTMFTSFSGTLTLQSNNSTITAGLVDIATGSNNQMNTYGHGAAHAGAILSLNGGTLNATNVGANPPSLVVGDTGDGVLNATGGAKINSVQTVIANTATSTGKVTIDGATWNNSSFLSLGANGTGTLTVKGGGQVTTNDTLYVGLNAGSHGTLAVSGGGSVTAYTTGVQGTTSVVVGTTANSTGTITITGTDSSLESKGDMAIGYGGTGTATVSGGGELTVDGTVFRVGRNAGSVGTLTVTGRQSSVKENYGTLYIGYQGTGTVNVQNGADLAVMTTEIGDSATGVGTLNIDGEGTTADLGDTSVGDGGEGTVSVTGGAEVKAGDMVLGGHAGDAGTVTISGEGTTLNLDGDFKVGDTATGTATVTTQATVNMQGDLTVGGMAGGEGTLTIDAGATVNVAGEGAVGDEQGSIGDLDLGPNGAATLKFGGGLTVGGNSNGSLTAQAGSKLIIGGSEFKIGDEGAGTGMVTLNGANFSFAGELTIGGNGIGELDMNLGATNTAGGVAVSAPKVTIGDAANSHGTLNMDGNGTRLIASELNVGESGQGTLNLTNQAIISVIGAANIGDQLSGATSHATVSTAGILSVSGDLVVGGAAIGILDINLGGKAAGGGDVTLGDSIDGSGTVTVDGVQNTAGPTPGSPSSLGYGKSLAVGGAGIGVLNITNGALVAPTPDGMGVMEIASDPAAVGTVNLSGAAPNNGPVSQLKATTLAIGGKIDKAGGTGRLNVSALAQADIARKLMIWGGGTLDLSGGGIVQVGTESTLLGAVNGGFVQVNAGGTVAGVGTIDGDVINNGLVIAGDDPGTLTINGDYMQGASGVLDIEVAGPVAGSPTGYSVLHVTGDATISGPVELSFLNNYKPTVGQMFNFLNVDGTTTGAFTGVTVTGLLTLDVTDTFTNSTIQITGVTRDYANATLAPLLTPNQRAVGLSLNPVANGATGDLNTLLTSIDNLTSAQQIGVAFDQLTAQRLQVFRNIAFDNFAFSAQQLDNHLANLREGMGGLDTSGFSFNDAALGSSLSQIKGHLLAWQPAPEPGLLSDTAGPVLGGVKMSDPAISENNRWSAFINGNVVLADLDATTGVSASNYTTGGVTLGADYRIDRHWTVGGLFGYSHTDADLDNEGSRATVETYSPGIYAAYADHGWYANGSATYGYNAYSENRNIIFQGFNRTAIGNPDGNQVSSDLDGGYEFHLGSLTVGPSAGLDYVHLNVGSFSEGNAGAASLNVQQQDADSLRSRLGFDARWHTKYMATDFTYHLNAHWQHEFMANSLGITSSLETPGAAPFTAESASVGRDSALLDAGVDVQALRNLDLFLGYQAEAGQSNFFAQSIQAGVKVGF